MGILDDAIREHLELKRSHGASDDEIRRKEAEAFGPVRQDAAPGAHDEHTQLAHHPYTKKTSPLKKDKSPDAITIANLNALPVLLDKIAKKTKLIPSGLPVVLTEFGWETNPPDRFNGISLATQATWDNLGDYAAYRNDRVMAN